MEHAKKMVLVPSETVERLQHLPVTNSHDPLDDLHKELSRILASRSMNDSEKWANYQQVLHRCLHHVEQRRKPLIFSIDAPDAERGEGEDLERGENRQVPLRPPNLRPPIHPLHYPPPALAPRRHLTEERASPPPHPSPQRAHHSRVTDDPVQDNEILATVPQTYRTKGSVLLQRLSKSDLIEWDEVGRVRIGNKSIQGSNIADLLNDALRKRKSVNAPNGVDEFCKVLAKINVPQELIGNNDRWNLIRQRAAEIHSPDSPHFNTLWPKAPVKVSKRSKSSENLNLAGVRRKLNWETFKF